MIGNDIVDLSISTIGEKERRSRFLEKILTRLEMDILGSLGGEDRYVWLIWSIKESVYKIVSRGLQKSIYAPKSIQCIDINCSGKGVYYADIHYGGDTFISKSIVNKEYIHTVASASHSVINQSDVQIFAIPKDADESGYTIRKVIESVRLPKSHNYGSLSVIKDKNRVPRIYDEETEIGYLSITHHGSYGAYVFIAS